MKIYIGADHSGYNLKRVLVPFLESLGHNVSDVGATEMNEKDDYTEFVASVARQVSGNLNQTRGIVIGGSGQGEAMLANRYSGVRCALYYGNAIPRGTVDVEGRKSFDPLENVKLSRLHNDSNILSLGARFITEDEAKEAIKAWLSTEFSGNDRHKRRIRSIDHGRPRSFSELIGKIVLITLVLAGLVYIVSKYFL